MPRIPRAFCLPILLAGLAGPAPAFADNIWYSPLNAYVSFGPTIRLRLERGNNNILVVRADRPVEEGFQDVNIPMAAPPGRVTGIKVCYKINTPLLHSTYIARIRLESVADPTDNKVLLHDDTDLSSIAGTCFTSHAVFRDPVIHGGLRLSLTTVFGSATDAILIGGIELMFDEPRLRPAPR